MAMRYTVGKRYLFLNINFTAAETDFEAIMAKIAELLVPTDSDVEEA